MKLQWPVFHFCTISPALPEPGTGGHDGTAGVPMCSEQSLSITDAGHLLLFPGWWRGGGDLGTRPGIIRAQSKVKSTASSGTVWFDGSAGGTLFL